MNEQEDKVVEILKTIFDPEIPVDLDIQVVYGDSVTGETCILLRDPTDNIVQVKSIKDLCNIYNVPVQLLNNTDSSSYNNQKEAKKALSVDLKVYPSYDLTEVTNFTLYGSLTKRFSASVTQIINFFPAAIEVDEVYFDYSTANTATNIVYNQNENTTSFDVDVSRIKNIFDIDFSENAARNIALRPTPVSPLRDMTSYYKDYSLFIGTGSTEYQFLLFTPSTSISSGTISVIVSGNPFSSDTTTTKTLVMRPNKMKTEMVFENDFDAVEKFLLNRYYFHNVYLMRT